MLILPMRAWRLRLQPAHPDPETGNVNPDPDPSLRVRSRVIGVRLRVGPWTDSALRQLGTVDLQSAEARCMLEEILNNRTLVHSIYYSNDEVIARIARFIASHS